jgi:hypothetical protein
MEKLDQVVGGKLKPLLDHYHKYLHITYYRTYIVSPPIVSVGSMLLSILSLSSTMILAFA